MNTVVKAPNTYYLDVIRSRGVKVVSIMAPTMQRP
jgi:hypothetical protein